MNVEKLVSVIIPTFKGSKQLIRAINSVLNQTYKNIEIFVIDDNIPNSLERKYTEEIMDRYNHSNRIKYIKHAKNRNGATARNTGIKQCRGEYICFLDDDDFYLPTRIEKSIETLINNPIYEGVYCSVAITNQRYVTDIIEANKELTKKDILLNEMTIGTGSNILISRKVIDEIGEFDETFIRHQDLEYMLRVLNSVRIINLNEILIVKSTNETSNIPNYIKYKEVKNKYWNKFRKDINELNKSEKKEFYIGQYRSLLYIAFKTKNKKYIKEAEEALKTVTTLTIKDKIYKFCTYIGIYNSVYFEKLKDSLKIIRRNNYYLLETELEKEILKYLD